MPVPQLRIDPGRGRGPAVVRRRDGDGGQGHDLADDAARIGHDQGLHARREFVPSALVCRGIGSDDQLHVRLLSVCAAATGRD
ncbi:MAG TPA: hypothetical protein DCS11_03430 [Syntrophus sp. (in: bacteria)]|nr:hypothetical protein [Syntrophus sp. (in: bacteria)]